MNVVCVILTILDSCYDKVRNLSSTSTQAWKEALGQNIMRICVSVVLGNVAALFGSAFDHTEISNKVHLGKVLFSTVRKFTTCKKKAK